MNPTLPTVDLAGKVALVTGGGRGIGRAIAQKLAASGAAVAICGRSQVHLDENVEIIRSAGRRAIRVTADVADRAAVERAIQGVESQLGAIDVLVNNAAIMEIGPVAEADPDAWWHIMEVNVRGPFLCARAVLPGMIHRKQGVIINVASGAAFATIAYTASYCASKAALVRFSDCLAAEVQQHNIAVFSLNPDAIRTDMTEYLVGSDAAKKYVPWYADFIAKQSDSPPELIGSVITFLASGQANSLSGRFIDASDNLADMLQRTDEILQNDLYMMRLRV